MRSIIPAELLEDRDEIAPILEESIADKHGELAGMRQLWMTLHNCYESYWYNRPQEFSFQGLKLQYRLNELGEECVSMEKNIKKLEAAIKEYYIEELPKRENFAELQVEEAREVPCEEIAQQFGVDIKKAGRQMRGCCPLHNEKTPSFFIDNKKNVWYCQGCHKGGDSIKLVEELRQCSFVDAVRYLTT